MPAVNEKRGLGLILAILGVLAMYAAFAPAAKATEITPANTTVNITNVSPSDFITDNAYGPDGVRCTSSSGTFTTPSDASPPDLNKNQPGVGTFSGAHGNGYGSVITDIEEISFTGCTQYDFDARSTGFSATTTTHGTWTVAAHASTIRDATLSIGVPPGGAVIEISIPFISNCVITVSNDRASSVVAEYHNPSQENPNGLADVDGQIYYSQTSNCQGSAPAQYEALYEPDVAVTVAP